MISFRDQMEQNEKGKWNLLVFTFSKHEWNG